MNTEQTSKNIFMYNSVGIFNIMLQGTYFLPFILEVILVVFFTMN